MTQEEFTSMVRSERPRLVRMASRLLGSAHEAEDVAQSALLKLWTMRGDIPNIRTVEAYATIVVRNLCLDHMRSRSVRSAAPIDEVLPQASEEPTPEEYVEQNDSLDQVERILSKLPTAQQAVMKMRHVEGLEIDEIARIMDMTEVNVRVILSRGRQRVRDMFFKLQKS
ncbi:MAG: sigma-70 family RNA polymerase sigma factor [Muribaculaceae bacterium]|nr:sigma-70 family RNA polymerase sigma factor [Muribaculaceae bacterium]